MAKGLPTKLKLLGRPVAVTSHPPEAIRGSWGECQTHEGKIRLSDAMTPIGEAHVLLHEIIHVYDDLMGMNLAHRYNDSMAHAIIDLIQNNPEFIKYIQGVKK